MKKSNKKTGQKGETEAYNFLLKQGYRILEKNYRFEQKEIDIIAKKDKLLVFVEVKKRKNSFYGYPEEAVNQNKIENIHFVADHYILENDWKGEIRFDIIAIIETQNMPEIKHFEDAF